jgi:hypothetical protein
LWVWLNGLPPEAAVWRVDGQQWTVRDELLAIVAERVDQWGLVQAHLHGEKKFRQSLPKEAIEISRPREAHEQKDEVITDPRVIEAFFA